MVGVGFSHGSDTCKMTARSVRQGIAVVRRDAKTLAHGGRVLIKHDTASRLVWKHVAKCRSGFVKNVGTFLLGQVTLLLLHAAGTKCTQYDRRKGSLGGTVAQGKLTVLNHHEWWWWWTCCRRSLAVGRLVLVTFFMAPHYPRECVLRFHSLLVRPSLGCHLFPNLRPKVPSCGGDGRHATFWCNATTAQTLCKKSEPICCYCPFPRESWRKHLGSVGEGATKEKKNM